MKYPRYEYKDPSVKLKQIIAPYSTTRLFVPEFDVPITPLENLIRALKRENPLWVPNSFSDVQNMGAQDVVTEDVRGMKVHTDFRYKTDVDYTFTDWFNTDWTWVCSAGGAMLTPGTKLLEDITDWERDIEWPDLSEWDFKDTAARFLKNDHVPEMALNFDIGRGCTERMISLVGGYTEGMLAFATEPEAIRAFCERYADHVIELFDKVNSLYPLNIVTYHDDWGTELDTFFSEKMMEDMIFEPTKRIIDHIRSKGVFFMLHSCGNVTRFMPYIIDMGADLLQIQRRAVNIPELKRKYGDKIGFNCGLEGVVPGASLSNESIVEIVKNSVDTYASKGGYLASIMAADEEQRWAMLNELYACSREFYDNEQGRA